MKTEKIHTFEQFEQKYFPKAYQEELDKERLERERIENLLKDLGKPRKQFDPYAKFCES